MENKIYIGNFYKTFTALEKPRALDCQQACQEDVTCEGITQNLGNGDCYLMSDVTGRKYQDKSLIAPKYCKVMGNFSYIFQHKINFYKYLRFVVFTSFLVTLKFSY